jgi:exonuclease III
MAPIWARSRISDRKGPPGIVCLQELKAPSEKFPIAAIREAGYAASCRHFGIAGATALLRPASSSHA